MGRVGVDEGHVVESLEIHVLMVLAQVSIEALDESPVFGVANLVEKHDR